MSRIVEIRRHSIKDGFKHGTIGPMGHALARAVGARQLRGRGFTEYHASLLWRTVQTMAAFGEGAGDFTAYFAPQQPDVYLPWPELFELWRTCHAAAKRGEDMVRAALAADRDLSARAASEGSQLFRRWALALPENANALVVGHSPYMELILHGLSDVLIPGLAECQGFRVHVDDDFRPEWESPDLNPFDIRRELFAP